MRAILRFYCRIAGHDPVTMFDAVEWRADGEFTVTRQHLECARCGARL